MIPIFVRRSGSGVLPGIGISKGHSRSLQLPLGPSRMSPPIEGMYGFFQHW